MATVYRLRGQRRRRRSSRRASLAIAAAAVAGAVALGSGLHHAPAPYPHHVAAAVAVHASAHHAPVPAASHAAHQHKVLRAAGRLALYHFARHLLPHRLHLLPWWLRPHHRRWFG